VLLPVAKKTKENYVSVFSKHAAYPHKQIAMSAASRSIDELSFGSINLLF
jgi:hypothetical protein